MNLNSFESFKKIDKEGMLSEIQNLPEQFRDAYSFSQELPIPEETRFKRGVIAGMGGSAIGGDLLAAYTSPELEIPLTVIRDYQLPGWAQGKQCLVVCSSHSGNTEETNSIFSVAIERNCTVIVITTGGKLLSRAIEKNITSWKYNHTGQPRAAVGWSFGLLLGLFERLNLIPKQVQHVENAIKEMEKFQGTIDVEVPIVKNPAKRQAGQLVNQYASIFGAEHLAPVARRWKTQINELAKCWCQFEIIPEADHNTLAGVHQPLDMLSKIFTVFLTSDQYHPRNKKRMDLTFTEFMVAGLCTDKINFSSQVKLAEIWKAILFGDYVAYYLAMIYEMDPTPVDAIESLKLQMH